MADKRVTHQLDCAEIDDLDEQADESTQYVRIWCETHQKYEWQTIPRSLIGCETLHEVTGPLQ